MITRKSKPGVVPVPRTNSYCDSSAIELSSESDINLCTKMNDISVAKTTRYPELNEGPPNARTPDNNDVPITRELSFARRSDVELGDSLKPNSFLQSSDSLDNNCILNGESVGADFDEDLDRFEGETVARFREELFLSQKPLTETELRAIASAVSSARFEDEPKFKGSHVNKRENKSYTGYYSEYFDVNKPVYNKRLIETNSRLVEVPRRESTGKSEPNTSPCTPSTNTWIKSFRKKEISKLISYFETEVSKIESSPETPMDFKSKIFDEVSAVRDRERLRVSRRSSCAVHTTSGQSYPETGQCKVICGPKVNCKSNSSKAHAEPSHRSNVSLQSTGWRSLDHQEMDYSPSSDNFEPDSLEPVCSSSVNSADWQSSKSQDSDCSSCTDSLGPVQSKPWQHGSIAEKCGPSCGRSSEDGVVQENRRLHFDLEPCNQSLMNLKSAGQKPWADQRYQPSSKQDIVTGASVEESGGSPVKRIGASRRCVAAGMGRPSVPEPSHNKLTVSHDDQQCQSLSKTVDAPTRLPSSLSQNITTVHNTGRNHCRPSGSSQVAGERLLDSRHPDHRMRSYETVKHCSVTHHTPDAAELVKPKPKSRQNKASTPEPAYHRPVDPLSSNRSVSYHQASAKLGNTPVKMRVDAEDPMSTMKWNAETTAAMQLDLLSLGDRSADDSPNIITPPFGFQNVFPPETQSDQLRTEPMALRDAELFSHVSVKNLRNKLSPQDEVATLFYKENHKEKVVLTFEEGYYRICNVKSGSWIVGWNGTLQDVQRLWNTI